MKNGLDLSNHVTGLLKAQKPKDNAVEKALSVAEGYHKPNKYFHGGLKSNVSGRTDHIPISVLSGSYVIPADIVSGLGEGNTMAGQKHLSTMFGGPEHGMEMTATQKPIPIIVAGGEYVLSPADIKKLSNGDVSKGHKMLDEFVRDQRKKLISTLKKLPNPKKD